MPQYLADTMMQIFDVVDGITCKDGEPVPVVQLAALLPQNVNPRRSMVAFAGMLLCYPVYVHLYPYLSNTNTLRSIYVLDCEEFNDQECTQAKALRDQPLWLVRLLLEGVDPRNEYLFSLRFLVIC